MDAVADALIQAIRSWISDNDAQPSTQQNEGSQQSSFRRTAAMSNSLTSPQPSTSHGIPFPSHNETSDVGRRKRKFVAPSMFQMKAKRRKMESKLKSVKYLRDIFCLPKSCMDEDGTVAILRSTRRSILASKEVGLMGKIEFSSDWSPKDMKRVKTFWVDWRRNWGWEAVCFRISPENGCWIPHCMCAGSSSRIWMERAASCNSGKKWRGNLSFGDWWYSYTLRASSDLSSSAILYSFFCSCNCCVWLVWRSHTLSFGRGSGLYSIDFCTAPRNRVIQWNLRDVTLSWNLRGQNGQMSICKLPGAEER